MNEKFRINITRRLSWRAGRQGRSMGNRVRIIRAAGRLVRRLVSLGRRQVRVEGKAGRCRVIQGSQRALIDVVGRKVETD